MKNKKYLLFLYSFSIFIILLISFQNTAFATDPKLVNTISRAFEKIESYILRISTPAAAVAIGSGILMKKFSFGDEEKIRTSKRIIRGSLFSYAFILCLDLILSLIESLLG